MSTFRALSRDPDPERLIPEVLPWVHEAGNPYFDWIFGGHQAARERIATWMKRPSSEVSISRVTLLFDRDRPIGGFLALGGTELAGCRKADTLALFKTDGGGRSGLMLRAAEVRHLFPRVEAEEFYLSKLWVVADLRVKGVGRALAMEYLAAGHAAGFRRFRLDVWAENAPAVRLYSSLGFQVARTSTSIEAAMKYFSMVAEHAKTER